MRCQIRNYPRLLHEIARLLRPGGLVILIEPELVPIAGGDSAAHFSDSSGLPGWFTFWETYRACLRKVGIDVTVPQRLSDLLATTMAFQNIVKQNGNIPVGFWPRGMFSY
jgi:hypothetical protein